MSLECGKMRSPNKILLLHTKRWLSQGKALIQLFELQAELATFCTEHHSYLKEWKNTDKLIFQTYIFGRYILGNEWNEPINSRKTDRNCCFAKDKILAFKQKFEFWKHILLWAWQLSVLPSLFLMSLVVTLMKNFFDII